MKTRVKRVGGKKVLVQLPDQIREDLDKISETECRFLNDTIREACRRYITDFKRSQPQRMQLDMVYALPASVDNVAEAPLV